MFVVWVGCAALLGAAWWLWTLRLARASLHWRAQRAIVEQVQVEHRDEDDGPRFRPRIRYRYTVGTRTWHGSRVRHAMPWTRDYGEAAAVLRGIVVGSEVTVYVHPRNHAMSVLLPGEPEHAVREFLATMLVVLCMLVYVSAS